MQSRVSLLSRLLRSPSDPAEVGSGARSAARVREDVLQHLRQICRTRLGSAPSVPSLGLPDLTDVLHGGGETPTFLTRALKRAIEAYEPRLVNVQVLHVPGETWDQVLRFEIHGQL